MGIPWSENPLITLISLLGELLLTENGWTDSSDFSAVLPKFFWETGKANFVTLTISGDCRVTYSLKGVSESLRF